MKYFEMIEMGRISGRYLFLIVQLVVESEKGPPTSVWGQVTPVSLIVTEGKKLYTYSLSSDRLELRDLLKVVTGLDGKLLSATTHG